MRRTAPEPRRNRAGAALVAAALLLPGAAVHAGEAGPGSLTGVAGDPLRGRAIVASRQSGLCLLCHAAPIAEVRFQGSLAPDLAGVGTRLSEGELRLRIVDPARANPETIMPAYLRTDALARVAPQYRGRPLLSAAQVEDVVAYLATLK